MCEEKFDVDRLLEGAKKVELGDGFYHWELETSLRLQAIEMVMSPDPTHTIPKGAIVIPVVILPRSSLPNTEEVKIYKTPGIWWRLFFFNLNSRKLTPYFRIIDEHDDRRAKEERLKAIGRLRAFESTSDTLGKELTQLQTKISELRQELGMEV